MAKDELPCALLDALEKVSGQYPEYYLLNMKRFDELARNTLDEWIYSLKTGEFRESFTAKGLKAAKEKLSILGLDEKEATENRLWQQRFRSIYSR